MHDDRGIHAKIIDEARLLLSAYWRCARPHPGRRKGCPATSATRDFDALMKTVDLEDPSLRLEYKKATSDGSSIGIYIGQGDKPTDASFVPTNTSSIPEARW